MAKKNARIVAAKVRLTVAIVIIGVNRHVPNARQDGIQERINALPVAAMARLVPDHQSQRVRNVMVMGPSPASGVAVKEILPAHIAEARQASLVASVPAERINVLPVAVRGAIRVRSVRTER